MAIITAQEVYDILYDEDLRTAATIETFASETIGTDGSVTEGTGTDNTVYIAPPMRASAYRGSLVKENELATLASPYRLGFTIQEGQRLTVGTETWTINEVKTYSVADDTVVAYEIGLVK